MTRRLALGAALAALLLLPAGAQAFVVGLADQKADSYADPRARALGLGYARLIVPYDAATSEPQVVSAWLAAVQAAGMQPHVAFEHLQANACPGRPCTLPSRATYGADVRAFIARFPQVRTYTTWNEANHVSQPTASHPEAVAGYYDELVAACPGCTIVAGDVLDSGTYTRWLQGFEDASDGTPQLWGLHDYDDVTYGTDSGVRNVLAAVPGRLWIEETGGIVALRNAAGRATLSVSESDAADAVDRAFAIARDNPRIDRMYVYQWRAKPLDSFDAGLVRPDGTQRPSLDMLARDLDAYGGRAAATPAATRANAAATSLRWSATWSKAHRLVVRARCRTANRRCAGRVTISLELKAARSSSRSSTRRLAKRAFSTSTAHPTRSLTLTVSAAQRRRIRRASARSLVLHVRPTRPSGALTRVAVALPKPS